MFAQKNEQLCNYINNCMRNATAFDKFEIVYHRAKTQVQEKCENKMRLQENINDFKKIYTKWMIHFT